MSWAVACFCGNVYAAPPDRCEVCGCSIDGDESGDPARSEARDARGVRGLAGERSRHCRSVVAQPTNQ
jgi:hypothetical protein